MTEQDDEDTGRQKPSNANAYWAKIRKEQEEQIEAHEHGDTFGGDYRGTRPRPRGGSAAVRPDQTIGADQYCWCGLPYGHDWPGKRVGAKHPKVEESTMSSDTGTKPDLDRRDLRAYHRRLQDFILSCVNEGVRYRMGNNAVILYPPDQSQPVSVYARNTDRQLRSLQKWYIEHVYVPPSEEPVDEKALAALAQAKNDPVEHPAAHKEPEPEPEEDEDRDTPNLDALMQEPSIFEAASTDDEWTFYVTQEGVTSPRIQSNGTHFRCIECIDTDHPLMSENVRSVGGHNRMYHTDTTNMRNEEARQKALETKRQRMIANSKINQAIELLIDFAGYEVQGSDAELEAAFGLMRERAEKAEQALADATTRADEAEAKLSLIREATGL